MVLVVDVTRSLVCGQRRLRSVSFSVLMLKRLSVTWIEEEGTWTNVEQERIALSDTPLLEGIAILVAACATTRVSC